MRLLYLSYDGILEPLGQSQVLGYLCRLQAQCERIHLISFEKPVLLRRDRSAVAALKEDLAKQGIFWLPLIYHKSPTVAATGYDIWQGIWHGWRLILRHRLALVHARSHVAALMGWMLARATNTRFIFDMRGFWADERAEAGIWPKGGVLYKIAKRLERRFVRDADATVVLAETGRAEIVQWMRGKQPLPITAVIPTCVDLSKFIVQRKPEQLLSGLGLQGRFILMYSGALGTWYLLDEMARFFQQLQRQQTNAHLLILTSQDPEWVRRELSPHRLASGDVTVVSAPFIEMPGWVSLADAAVLFRHPAYSLKGVCPTKVGEFLSCGIPVVLNAGIGDCDALIRENRIGVVVSRFDADSHQQAAVELTALMQDPQLKTRCRLAAESRSLERGAAAYSRLYESVLNPGALFAQRRSAGEAPDQFFDSAMAGNKMENARC